MCVCVCLFHHWIFPQNIQKKRRQWRRCSTRFTVHSLCIAVLILFYKRQTSHWLYYQNNWTQFSSIYNWFNLTKDLLFYFVNVLYRNLCIYFQIGWEFFLFVYIGKISLSVTIDLYRINSLTEANPVDLVLLRPRNSWKIKNTKQKERRKTHAHIIRKTRRIR